MPQGRDPEELWQGRKSAANKGVEHKAISRGWEVRRDLRFKKGEKMMEESCVKSGKATRWRVALCMQRAAHSLHNSGCSFRLQPILLLGSSDEWTPPCLRCLKCLAWKKACLWLDDPGP